VAISAFRDVDGDTYPDFVIGKYFDGKTTSPTLGKGTVSVLHGGAPGLLGTPLVSISGAISDGALGYELRTINDLDGDGKLEIAVSATACDQLHTSSMTAGSVTIYSVTPSGSTYQFQALASVSGNVGDFFGASLSSGDMDGDLNGRDELAIAARRAHRNGDNSGTVFVYSLDGSPLQFDELFHINGEEGDDGDRLGRVTLDGDVTKDGLADLLTGSGHVDGSAGANSGAAYVVTRNVEAASALFGNHPIPGTSLSPPSLSIGDPPTIGANHQLLIGNTTLDNGNPRLPLATSATLQISSTRDPNDNDTILLINPMSYGFGFSQGQWTYSFASAIVLDPALIGTHQYLQAFVQDANAPSPPGGVAISQALDLTLSSPVWPHQE
jgi:hypothetical protein